MVQTGHFGSTSGEWYIFLVWNIQEAIVSFKSLKRSLLIAVCVGGGLLNLKGTVSPVRGRGSDGVDQQAYLWRGATGGLLIFQLFLQSLIQVKFSQNVCKS